MYYRKGDIVSTLGFHPISISIQIALTRKGEAPTFANHDEIIVNNCERLEDVETVAALGSGVVRHNLCDAYGGKKDEVEIWTALNFTDEERDIIADAALTYVGGKYPWHRLVFQLLDEWIFGGRYLFRRLAVSDKWRICTPLVVQAIWAAGYNFGFDHPTQANPDNLRDYLENNPDKYRCIRKLARIE